MLTLLTLGSGLPGRNFGALSKNQNHMIQIIIKQIEFFVNPELIPSQRNEVSQKIFLVFIKTCLRI